MGLIANDQYVDDSTGVALPGAYMAIRDSQISIRPTGSDTDLEVSCSVPIWKDHPARQAAKAAVTFFGLEAQVTIGDIEKRGLYGVLYESLKASAPAFSQDG